ncbi:hypothetical protein K443DRAFT_679936 [Laccaria amethystina LaAM-08-1]|uniref:Uncharacterized protein n=1 Tax=Laccaria amethystina LaAM-08-1 TaxID=1095629 RepID=A0A0C9XD26_9AGAR|nr:hypothetical protein K443DRAFT_679936 [Laccaria amethystina LaAM-08-1]
MWLGRGRDLTTLYEALKRSYHVPSDATPQQLPLGWWTKRIDVAMRESGITPVFYTGGGRIVATAAAKLTPVTLARR